MNQGFQEWGKPERLSFFPIQSFQTYAFLKEFMDLGLKKTLPVPLVLLGTFLSLLSSLHFITKLTISWYLEPLKPWTLDLKST